MDEIRLIYNGIRGAGRTTALVMGYQRIREDSERGNLPMGLKIAHEKTLEQQAAELLTGRFPVVTSGCFYGNIPFQAKLYPEEVSEILYMDAESELLWEEGTAAESYKTFLKEASLIIYAISGELLNTHLALSSGLHCQPWRKSALEFEVNWIRAHLAGVRNLRPDRPLILFLVTQENLLLFDGADREKIVEDMLHTYRLGIGNPVLCCFQQAVDFPGPIQRGEISSRCCEFPWLLAFAAKLLLRRRPADKLRREQEYEIRELKRRLDAPEMRFFLGLEKSLPFLFLQDWTPPAFARFRDQLVNDERVLRHANEILRQLDQPLDEIRKYIEQIDAKNVLLFDKAGVRQTWTQFFQS